MGLKDWIAIIGWIVTFALGIVSGGLILPRLTRKRAILKWALANETEIVPKELSQRLGLPVVLSVGGSNPTSLSVVTLRVGSAGEEIIKDLDLVVSFNSQASILNAKPADDLGEYERHIKWTVDRNRCRVALAFLNPGQEFRLEFVVSDYDPGSADVDAAAPGLQLRRRDPSKWEIPTSVLRGVGLSVIGVRYDPAAISMSEIASELRAVRRYMTRVAPSTKTESLNDGDASHLYRLVKSDSQLSIVKYMHGVDDEWIPLKTLASFANMTRDEAKAFLDQLCRENLAAAQRGVHDEEFRLSYRVGSR